MVLRRPRLSVLLRSLVTLTLCAGIALGVFMALQMPSNSREWMPDQALTATASFDGDAVVIHNLRNARYRSIVDYDVRWEMRRFDLRDLDSVWYVVEPFADWRGPAHTFLSFGFRDGRHLAVSVEIRKERGETFSPLRGLLRQYELMYVLGDERDLIGLRANHRDDDVYLYPIRATPQARRAMLVDVLKRANALAEKPEFYNTLTANCTSSIIEHVDHVAPRRVPATWRSVLPGYSDDLAFDLGLIDTALPRSSYRAAHRINAVAAEGEAMDLEGAEFSAAIRQGLPKRQSGG